MTSPAARRGRRRGTSPTIGDVAARAKVDPSVVSRVLNADPKLAIRPETRQRVLDAVEELAYRPNAAARSLRTARAGTYGLVIPDFANPVYAEIIKGAEQAALDLGCLLLTGSSARPGLPAGAYVDLLGQGRIDGLLLGGDHATTAMLDELTERGVPWLLVNRRARSHARYVVFDDERAVGLAVQHLLELGHERIGHIAGPPTADTARRRRNGYRAALKRAGLGQDEQLVARGDYAPGGGARAMSELLALDDPPTAVFVGNVASAIGALDAARAQGVRVPQDVSVVAIHDLELAAYLSPALTTVRMPLAELGRRAVELLATKEASAEVKEVVAEPMELVVRASTARRSG